MITFREVNKNRAALGENRETYELKRESRQDYTMESLILAQDER